MRQLLVRLQPYDELMLIIIITLFRSGWGATITDGLSTAIMMEFPDIVQKQLVFISKLDFTKAGGRVSLFETTVS